MIIKAIDVIRQIRNPLPLKPVKVMKSKKVYNRKDKNWKKEVL